MKNLRTVVLSAIVALSCLALGAFHSGQAVAASAEDLNRDSTHALSMLLKVNPLAADIAQKAKGILIFPNIVKAGFIFGGAYGEGVLKENNVINGYYNSVTASFGWQAGGQSYGYVVFLMSDEAVRYLRDTQGWEIGVGPTVVLVNAGVAKNLSSSTLHDDVYAFIFNQQGLMASLSIEGSKINKITK